MPLERHLASHFMIAVVICICSGIPHHLTNKTDALASRSSTGCGTSHARRVLRHNEDGGSSTPTMERVQDARDAHKLSTYAWQAPHDKNNWHQRTASLQTACGLIDDGSVVNTTTGIAVQYETCCGFGKGI